MRIIQTLKPAHLLLIVKIADTGKLSLAAAALSMAQPGASRILSEIEKTTGGQLFYRDPRGMVPTELGQTFVRHARQILMQLESLKDDVLAVVNGNAGSVSIGSVTGPMLGSVIPAVQALKSRNPDVMVSLHVAPSAQLVRGLEEGAFDFIFARLPPGHTGYDLDLMPWSDEEIDLIVNRSHPLAEAKSLTLAELTDWEWVLQNPGSPIRSAVEAAFHVSGLQGPRNVTNTSSILATLALLFEGRAVTAQPREVAELLAARHVGHQLVTLPVEAEIAVPSCQVITRKTTRLSAAASHFLEYLLARRDDAQPGALRSRSPLFR